MDRRLLLSSSLAFIGASAVAKAQDLPPPVRNESGYGAAPPPPAPPYQGAPPAYQGPPPESDQAGAMPPPRDGLTPNYKADTYSKEELVNQVSDFFGVGAEAAGAVVVSCRTKPLVVMMGSPVGGRRGWRGADLAHSRLRRQAACGTKTYSQEA